MDGSNSMGATLLAFFIGSRKVKPVAGGLAGILFGPIGVANTAENIALTPWITLMVLMDQNTAMIHLITPMRQIHLWL